MSARGLLLLVPLLCCGASAAEPDPARSLDALLEQVRAARSAEAQGNEERERRFLAEEGAQRQRLTEAQAELAAERLRGAALQETFEANERRRLEAESRLHERADGLDELLGIARQVAGEAKAIFEDSLISTQIQGRAQAMGRLAQGKGPPPIGALEDLWFALQQEMTESGKVVRYDAAVIGADGSERRARVTRIGPFSAVADGRFLQFIPETGQLQELPRQPARRYRRLAAGLESASASVVPMVIDPSRGAVLSLLARVPDLGERIQQGRVVGYIIIAVALVGLLIAVERIVHLAIVGHRMRVQIKSDIPNRGNPLGRVLAVYSDYRHVGTETLELKLDERILSELPRLQRGLQTLRILAVIAPLLGLLGTVTGLIDTFQSITLFGTGDPRLMAGGISEALVTTVLGLTTAIPLILLHSAVATRSARLVNVLEEQSAGIIAAHAERQEGHAAAA